VICVYYDVLMDMGREIISLKIEKGVLIHKYRAARCPVIGPSFLSKQWFIVGRMGQKEYSEASFLHFYNQKDVLVDYKKASTHATLKKDRGVIIIDAMNMSVWKKIGETKAIVVSY